jgi:hypothetical protein
MQETSTHDHVPADKTVLNWVQKDERGGVGFVCTFRRACYAMNLEAHAWVKGILRRRCSRRGGEKAEQEEEEKEEEEEEEACPNDLHVSAVEEEEEETCPSDLHVPAEHLQTRQVSHLAAE